MSQSLLRLVLCVYKIKPASYLLYIKMMNMLKRLLEVSDVKYTEELFNDVNAIGDTPYVSISMTCIHHRVHSSFCLGIWSKDIHLGNLSFSCKITCMSGNYAYIHLI